MATKTRAKKKSTKKRSSKKKAAAKVNPYEDWRNRARAESRERGTYWKVPKGRSVIRLIPFVHNNKVDVWVPDAKHFNVDPESNAPVLCPGADCPICELKDSLPAVWEAKRDSIRRDSTFVANAIVRSDPDGLKNELVIAQLAWSVVKGDRRRETNGLQFYIVGSEGETAPCPNAIDDKKGRDFKIEKTGKGYSTKYTVLPMPKDAPIGVDVEPRDLITDREARMKSMEELEQLAEALKEKHGK